MFGSCINVTGGEMGGGSMKGKVYFIFMLGFGLILGLSAYYGGMAQEHKVTMHDLPCLDEQKNVIQGLKCSGEVYSGEGKKYLERSEEYSQAMFWYILLSIPVGALLFAGLFMITEIN